jgi:hypothetical protein
MYNVQFWRFTTRYNETGCTDTGKEDEKSWHERTNTMRIAAGNEENFCA